MYADDTSLLLREHRSSTAEEVLGDAAEWFGANNLKLNADKSQSLQFTAGVSGEGSVRFLGVCFDHVGYTKYEVSPGKIDICRPQNL
ncbi:hypothetical protein QE152_g22317 [Popillia japonica]|uniref:Reverse transcriptase domain-containing protein n=1 Tax=Popillia japonica TaxID=7064 RepID=A0AAW1KJ45_POPJA